MGKRSLIYGPSYFVTSRRHKQLPRPYDLRKRFGRVDFFFFLLLPEDAPSFTPSRAKGAPCPLLSSEQLVALFHPIFVNALAVSV